MQLRTQVEGLVASHGAASVIEELIHVLRDDASLLEADYPYDCKRKLQLADKLANVVGLARKIQN